MRYDDIGNDILDINLRYDDIGHDLNDIDYANHKFIDEYLMSFMNIAASFA